MKPRLGTRFGPWIPRYDGSKPLFLPQRGHYSLKYGRRSGQAFESAGEGCPCIRSSISVLQLSHLVDDDLKALLATARGNNSSLGVSGMLLYHEGSFMQVLEGEQSAVESIFAKIEKDDRHTNTTILSKGEMETRTFESWAMGFLPSKSLSDIPKGFHPFLKRGFRRSTETEGRGPQRVARV